MEVNAMEVQSPLKGTSESGRGAQWARLLACLGLLSLLAGCSPSNATGTYLAKFTNGLARLELVQAGDHSISGEIDWASYDSNGKLSTSSASVSGAIDGHSVNLTFKGNGFLAGTTTGAGELGWSGITLTGDFNGGTLSTAAFKKVSPNEYQVAFNTTKSAANAIVVAKGRAEAEQRQNEQKANFLGKMSALTLRLQHFEQQADIHLQRFPKAESIFAAITSDMQKKLDRERQLSDERYSVVRGQLSVSINQDSISMDQTHNGLGSLENSFRSDVLPALTEAEQMEAICLDKARPAYLAQNCDQLSDALKSAKPKLHAFALGVDHLEEVYQQQQQRQKDIIVAANAAE